MPIMKHYRYELLIILATALAAFSISATKIVNEYSSCKDDDDCKHNDTGLYCALKINSPIGFCACVSGFNMSVAYVTYSIEVEWSPKYGECVSRVGTFCGKMSSEIQQNLPVIAVQHCVDNAECKNGFCTCIPPTERQHPGVCKIPGQDDDLDE